jgi:hypothetical protein
MAGAAGSRQDALLATKLHVPRRRPGFVPRPRLAGQLEEGLARGLVLVCAPAGSGKTVLLADWAQRGGRPVAWLSLDAGDNDPARFWRYVVAALGQARPGIGELAGPVLGPLEASSPDGLVMALRARRRQFLAMLADRLRGGRGDGNRLIPLDEVVGPVGWRGQRQLGLQTIRLDTIVGTAGARRDFDRRFRPTSTRPRSRWEQLALAQRRGAAIPPIEVYRVGHLHFVADGHHRVSIAAATRQHLIDAHVTEVLTAVPPGPRPLARLPEQAAA